MLAPNEKKTNLYLDYCRGIEQQMRTIETRMGPYRAEVVPERGVEWYALVIAAGHENIAASHLSSRGFGIYLPEFQVTEVRRGRKAERMKLLLPGYLFIHVWDLDRHTDRIRACPGVIDFMKIGGLIVPLSWKVINEIRVIENIERPIQLPMSEVIEGGKVKKKKGRWRKSRVQAVAHQEPEPILCVHAWSPFIEEMRAAGLDDEDRLSAFHRRLSSLGS